MDLYTARSLAWSAERGGLPLPVDVAAKVGYVLAKGAEVDVAAPGQHFIKLPDAQPQAE